MLLCFDHHCLLIFRLKLDSDEDEEEQYYYNDDPELPMFSTVPNAAESVALLLMDPEPRKVCHVQPMGVTHTATFVIDLDDIHFPDLKADDLGSWKPNGTKATCFDLLVGGEIQIITPKPKKILPSSYILTRRYYVHGTCNQFRRVIVDVRGNYCLHAFMYSSNGVVEQKLLVCY